LVFQNDFVEKVKREVSLESYISRYVRLKRAGKRSIGLCPFHSEKTPSFSVSNDLQLYHCFGCGKSGDLFTFVQEYDKVDFKKSLEILSEYSGIPLDKFGDPEGQEQKQKFFSAKPAIFRLFQKQSGKFGGICCQGIPKKKGY